MITNTSQARDNKLTIEDMAGGTFTISNVSFSFSPKSLSNSMNAY
jgi:pyruvate/2-oxoglutarate dehydrogenase complex dihydrolipoamide acyltransferase (E2) component